mmetsp:Transcript_48971/g.93592  ORF Transcript_48971/g.93592 Transcript_48971/m.93592 type:complete len:120 (+) Transcript_48971:403-762(+)
MYSNANILFTNFQRHQRIDYRRVARTRVLQPLPRKTQGNISSSIRVIIAADRTTLAAPCPLYLALPSRARMSITVTLLKRITLDPHNRHRNEGGGRQTQREIKLSRSKVRRCTNAEDST